MDEKQELRMFLKKDLREVIHEKDSIMPASDERTLPDNEMMDLLAYLDNLRGLTGEDHKKQVTGGPK